MLQWSDRNLDTLSDLPDLEGDEDGESDEAVDVTFDSEPGRDEKEESNKSETGASPEQETFDDEGATAAPIPSSAYFLRQASIDLQTDLIYLVRYSLEKEMQEFTNAVHECCICFCTKSGKHFVRLNQCRHHFCKECITTYCTDHVKEGTVDSLK